jgi:hypothetical protein
MAAANSTWTSRDLPVLTAIVEVYERTGRVMRPNEIVEQPGVDADHVEAALRALEGEDPPFITKLERRASGGISLIGKPTGQAKGWLRKTAASLGNAGRDLAVEIGATAINRQMGM